MDFELNLALFDLFLAAINIEHRRLIIICECILQVIRNQAGFTNSSVSYEYDLNAIIFGNTAPRWNKL